MKNKVILLILCGCAMSYLLFAQVTATWNPADTLQFGPAPSPMDTNKFAVHIGTLTFTVQGNQLFDPNILHIDFDSGFTFYGPMSWSNDNSGNPVYSDQSSNFHLVAVSILKGIPEVKNLDQGDGASPIRSDSGNFNTRELVVDLYILGYQDWIRYQPGALYTLTQGSLNTFRVGVAANGSGYDNSGYQIPVEGFGMGDVQFLKPGNSFTNPVPYGPPNNQVEYLFSIIINQQNFTISDAYYPDKAEVASLALTLNNSESSLPYTFQIVFTNQTKSQNFSLHLDDPTLLKVIPYVLEFNNQHVYGNQAINWSVSGDQQHVEKVFVTSIDSVTAENAVAGSYTDTITVEIIPPDTI
ncbi:hypothetical protein [Sphaerochaeta halotolerans]|jgi:hypothetical protein|uniref:hypothetical protein n=1 Tax=Sphaerochaeta halotolerans TaxID=2293840 RepID=UPI0013706FB5|nr:hypothetical protein [Sphaerochaeta halotolerans]MXI87405.1 hypothetical protein [Sphaerochaeta halotolerans]